MRLPIQHSQFAFLGPQPKWQNVVRRVFPTQKNTSKIYIHAFSHTKSQIRFFDVFPGFSLFFRLTPYDSGNPVTVTPESNHRRLAAR